MRLAAQVSALAVPPRLTERGGEHTTEYPHAAHAFDAGIEHCINDVSRRCPTVATMLYPRHYLFSRRTERWGSLEGNIVALCDRSETSTLMGDWYNGTPFRCRETNDLGTRP